MANKGTIIFVCVCVFLFFFPTLAQFNFVRTQHFTTQHSTAHTHTYMHIKVD